jgi:hypothetical protein
MNLLPLHLGIEQIDKNIVLEEFCDFLIHAFGQAIMACNVRFCSLSDIEVEIADPSFRLTI